jgi:rhodanese-related sulfurtransferase
MLIFYNAFVLGIKKKSTVDLFICFIFLLLILLSCKGQPAKNYESINALTFHKKIDSIQNVQLIDVRTPLEYNNQHLENSLNIDWNGETFEEEIRKLDKKNPVFVYCMKGGRSRKASKRLHDLGFKKVYELDGGVISWNNQSLPIIKKAL